MAPARPHANHLHLAPDRQPCQYLTTQFLQAGCPSCRPTNSINVLYQETHMWINCETGTIEWYQLTCQSVRHRLTPLLHQQHCHCLTSWHLATFLQQTLTCPPTCLTFHQATTVVSTMNRRHHIHWRCSLRFLNEGSCWNSYRSPYNSDSSCQWHRRSGRWHTDFEEFCDHWAFPRTCDDESTCLVVSNCRSFVLHTTNYWSTIAHWCKFSYAETKLQNIRNTVYPYIVHIHSDITISYGCSNTTQPKSYQHSTFHDFFYYL